MRKFFAEFFGTFWLVFGGCGSALLSCSVDHGIGYTGVALAFGLSVVTMAYAVGHISGGHFNPAVSLGLCVAGRMNFDELPGYILAQICGATSAAALLYSIVSGHGDVGNFAANGYGDLSPEKYSAIAVFITEFVLTAFFILIILGTTTGAANSKFAGLAIGLALVLIHLISIPVSNTSVNPARSVSQALFAGGPYLSQLWMFIIAPLLGACTGGLIYKHLLSERANNKF